MNIFVTGGTGFLGHNTILRLLDEGHHVFALVRQNNNLLSGIHNHNLSLVQGSLEERSQIRSSLSFINTPFLFSDFSIGIY